MRKPNHESTEAPAERLLAAILAGTGGLDGAACRGEHDLFDPRDHDRDETPEDARARHVDAAAICALCPALATCRSFAVAHPNTGAVLGATLPEHRGPGRPRKDTAA